MRVLVLGSGGREHALVWKLAQESEVFAYPGNPGIVEDIGEDHILKAESLDDDAGIARLCNERNIDLVVVGPENPLVDGLADRLRTRGIRVFGPGAEGARLEGSKAFSKQVMTAANVPTARYRNFTDAIEAKNFARELAECGNAPVIKASGNALGKGVIVANSIEEADEAIEMMLVDREFGAAGGEIVVEERLLGFEFSLLTICSGLEIQSLPVAQDYKRALDGDRGPNTGGMGTYSPVASVSESMVLDAEGRIVRPVLSQLRERGIDYRGILFSGIMVQGGQPYCLEYNVRFGDPETQSVMRRLGSGFTESLKRAALGETMPEIEVLDLSAVTVVIASAGYPGNYEKGQPIEIPPFGPDVKVFHAGTGMTQGRLVNAGGRVLGVSAVGASLEEARRSAYGACSQIAYPGKYFRKDIAASPL